MNITNRIILSYLQNGIHVLVDINLVHLYLREQFNNIESFLYQNYHRKKDTIYDSNNEYTS